MKKIILTVFLMITSGVGNCKASKGYDWTPYIGFDASIRNQQWGKSQGKSQIQSFGVQGNIYAGVFINENFSMEFI